MNIKHITSVWRATLAALVILASLAAFSSVPVHAHCKGKHSPPNAHCDGDPGGGTSEIAVSTTFNCPVGASRDCPAGNPSAFQADFAASPYVHDDDNVRNLFNSTGGFVLTMHKRQNKFGTRKVWWKFPDGVAVDFGSEENVIGTDDLDNRLIDHKTVIQVGKFTAVDLRALAPSGGFAMGVDMLLDLQVATSKNKSEILFVRYSPTANGQCPGTPPRANSGVTVTRTDNGSGVARAWTIEVAAGAMACIYKSETEDYGDFDFGPLVLTVTEQL